jgi:hypothetical protein
MEIGPSERSGSIELVDSGLTIGQYWQNLSPVEKRAELANWNVIAGVNQGEVYAILHEHTADRQSLRVVGSLPAETLERYELTRLNS